MTKQVNVMERKAEKAMKDVMEKAKRDLKDAKVPEYVQDAETVQKIQSIQARYLSAKSDVDAKIATLKDAKNKFVAEGRFIIDIIKATPTILSEEQKAIADGIIAKYSDTSRIDEVISEAEKASEKYGKILAYFTYKMREDGKVEYSSEAEAVAAAIDML